MARARTLTRVARTMAELGWHGTGHGRHLYLVDFRTGEAKACSNDDWIDADESDD